LFFPKTRLAGELVFSWLVVELLQLVNGIRMILKRTGRGVESEERA
jgi:hypothetical protein